MLSIWWKKRANWYQNGHPSWWWPRWYNLLTAPEIAVLLPDLGYPDVVAIRDIVLHAYGGVIKRITETQYAYDLLHYVMLFPLNDGWHTGIPHNRSTGNVTAIEFYCYHLMIKSGSHHLHLFGNLFYQYIVDTYTKIEQQRLNNIKTHQQKIRVDFYSELADAVAKGDLSFGTNCYSTINYTNSPRQMFQQYQDAMTIVQKQGNLDLFIIVTCNQSTLGWQYL